MVRIGKAVSVLLVFAMVLGVSLSAVQAAGNSITIGTPVEGEFSFAGAGLAEYSLRLDSQTDVGFIVNGWSTRGPEVFHFNVAVQDANGNGFSVGFDGVDDVRQPNKGEIIWIKNPVPLPAGDYTVVINAYDYVFGEEGPDGLEPNDLVVTYMLTLTGGRVPVEVVDMPGYDPYDTSDDVSYAEFLDNIEPILVIDMNSGTYEASGTARTLSPGIPAPFLDGSGNTLVPIRFLEDMGVTGPIWFDEATETVQIDMLDKSVYVQIGSPQYKIEAGTVSEGTLLDAAGNPVSPRLIENRTYLPLRAILTQCLGFENIYYWDGVIKVYG